MQQETLLKFGLATFKKVFGYLKVMCIQVNFVV